MTEHPARVPPPALAAGDVYLYAHANGALFVLESDGRSRLAPLDEAVAVAAGCHAAACRVRAGWDDAPLAEEAIGHLRRQGIPLDVVDGAAPPQTWHHGTTALMEAAAHGNDRLLDDLVARRATLHDRDASGSTALHHAAANGNLHAVDALVGAGLDADDRNADGFTPYRLAVAARQLTAAQRLADLGADTGAGTTAAMTFHRSHRRALFAWLLIPAVDVAAAAIIGITVHPLAGLAFAVVALGVLRFVAPPREAWAGGAPVRLQGTTLTIRGIGPARDVDLRLVTAAAVGGAPGGRAEAGARWLLLDHPEGSPADRDLLRRLAVPPAELDALAARVGRVLVVPMAGGRHDEVLLAVGNVLSGLGVDLSASLRAHLDRTRRDSRAR
ncbi:MAG TPA: ankyrin repeat domain-containing protein [Acidimicrobiales bacterium]|nr:ankyrin repeat domain-containing protein [Acidimicrobiales bacterium]